MRCVGRRGQPGARRVAASRIGTVRKEPAGSPQRGPFLVPFASRVLPSSSEKRASPACRRFIQLGAPAQREHASLRAVSRAVDWHLQAA